MRDTNRAPSGGNPKMARAEEVALFDKPTARNPIEAAKNELVAAVTEPKTPRARYVIASLVMQVALLGIVAGVGMLVARHLLALEAASHGESAAVSDSTARINELNEKTAALSAQSTS